MKHEWKKAEKEYYGLKPVPTLIEMPKQQFIAIKGKGNPNNEDFALRVGALYSLAFPIKMGFKGHAKQNPSGEGMDDYTVYPLEGVWDTSNPDNVKDKDSYKYTIMIRQPDAITREMFEETREKVKKKKPSPLLDEVEWITQEDGLCVQIRHDGPYDDEPASFAKMDALVKEQGLRRKEYFHREIYLTDSRKTQPEKMKTILRYQVEK